MLRYPNRTGEIGTYAAGVVTLSDQALPGMRTFAAARASARIDGAGDAVGVSIKALSSPDLWTVGIAEYDAGAATLTLTRVEDSSATALGADALVEVTACVTDGMLRGMPYVEPVYAYGPPAWSVGASAAWEAFPGHWRVTEDESYGTLLPSAETAALRPSTFALDFFLPPGAAVTGLGPLPGFVLQYGGGALEVGVTEPAEGWNTASGSIIGQTGDITSLLLMANYPERALYRFRNLIATV